MRLGNFHSLPRTYLVGPPVLIQCTTFSWNSMEFFWPDPFSAHLLQLCCFLVTLKTVQRERPSTCNRQCVQMHLALLPAVDAMEIFKQPQHLITTKIPQNKHRRLVKHTMTCASASLDITWSRATAAETLHGFRILTCARLHQASNRLCGFPGRFLRN